MPFHCISNPDLGQFSCPAEDQGYEGLLSASKVNIIPEALSCHKVSNCVKMTAAGRSCYLLPDALPSHISRSLLLSSTSLLGTQTDHLVIPACIHLCSTEAKRTKLSLAAHLARPGFFCGFTDQSLQPHGPTFSPERSERFLHYVSGPSHDAFP